MPASNPVIVVGADHAAFHLKETLSKFLKSQGYQVEDVGCYSESSVDYPKIAELAALRMERLEVDTGIPPRGLICCGSGIGICISANRFPWIRAAVVHDHFAAMMSRRHNDANVISFGARVIAPELAQELLETWLKTEFDGGRHSRRVEQMAHLETNPNCSERQETTSC